MWAVLGIAVSCGLALWHLLVTVPRLTEPTVEEVGEEVLAVKPRYASLVTPTRTAIVIATAALCGFLSTLAPRWSWGVWWVWSGSVATLVAVDQATTFLPVRLWRRCVAESVVALATTVAATSPPPIPTLAGCLAVAAASTGFFWLMWRLSSSLGYGDVRLAAGTGFVGATTGVSSVHPGVLQAGMTTLLAATVLGALLAIATTLIRRRRPSPWGSAFAYGPALWSGPWAALVISLG
ncbi:leader peptidase (prepilin peptidase)/N-methyltransferase [Cutibacterium equinum]|uniref:Leader peptidase (Prepilin peptidase)/N-methyltransferase n=1 Tax=Cutibacterium equinum TaxID=3016342 RepID=A0ABY7QZS1_9ACTN|nr:leader peptidase (prepilin peptidase)/N-methyltransferase [Cutibacterium equinum]WCC80544.1 leader peptidase (prepilin peptidase)/N-methyltransferase [Cutibacterium equinum]